MKRFVTLALACLLVAGMTVPALAADDTTSSDTATKAVSEFQKLREAADKEADKLKADAKVDFAKVETGFDTVKDKVVSDFQKATADAKTDAETLKGKVQSVFASMSAESKTLAGKTESEFATLREKVEKGISDAVILSSLVSVS